MKENATKRNLCQFLLELKEFKTPLSLSIICNILLSLFTVISIPLIIPFFQVLFDQGVELNSESPSMLDVPGYLRQYFATIINEDGKEKALIFVCFATVLVFFAKNLFRYLALFFMAPVRNGIIRRLRSSMYNTFLDLPLGYFTDQKKGDLMTRMANDVQEVEWSILNMIEVIFKSPLVILGSIILMLMISPSLTGFVFILMIFTGTVIGVIGKTLKKKSHLAQALLSNINTQVEESLSGIKTIKGFGAEAFQQSKFEKYNRNYTAYMNRILRRKDLSSPLSEWLGVTVVAILMWFGSQQVLQNALEPELFFAFIFAFYQVIEPSKSFSSAYYNIQKGMAALERIDEVLYSPAKNLEIKSQEKLLFDNNIRLFNVTFSYNKQAGFLIDRLDLNIQKGEKIALVGASGAGKTTIMDLIAGFYNADSGIVEIDGISTSNLSKKSRQTLFGMVGQSTFLFNGSIAENLSLGREQVSDKELWKALEIAQLSSFVQDLPEKILTNIGDNGVKLSGGQRQRLSIARAVLKDPPIILLDEATSNLDSTSEILIQKAFDQIFKDRTVIVIAHRLSTIQNCDRIVVLQNGNIIQVGNHKELIKEGGLYKKMIEMQTFTT